MNTKITTLAEIKEFSNQQKKKNKIIVLAHGTYDLMHIGHVKHLKFAKNYGDVLIVTITADQFVSKGPGRPFFNQGNRSEMLASLEFVDKVCIIDSRSGIPAINSIRPDFYIKGIEYKNKKNDLTKKISYEEKAIKKFGGKIIYSKEETFSSSNLLNNFFNQRSEDTRKKINSLKNKNIVDKILKYQKKIENLKVCLIGDSIKDIYKFVSPLGKSPKENLISNLFLDKKEFNGGVLAAANNLSSFCNKIDVITHAYNTNLEKKLILKFLSKSIKIKNFKKNNCSITEKTRYVEKGFNRKLFSVYSMNDYPLDGKYEKKLLSFLKKNLRKYDLVIVTDFGHGFITGAIIKLLEKYSNFLSVNAQSNSSNYGFNLITKYKKADYISIDLPEARLAAKNRFGTIEDLLFKDILKKTKVKNFSLTLGRDGCAVTNGKKIYKLGSLSNVVVDTMGAGDVFFVITSIFAFFKFDISELALIGNCAGGLKVNILGHQKSILKEDLLTMIKTSTL